jgi:hypothetical protein
VLSSDLNGLFDMTVTTVTSGLILALHDGCQTKDLKRCCHAYRIFPAHPRRDSGALYARRRRRRELRIEKAVRAVTGRLISAIAGSQAGSIAVISARPTGCDPFSL